MRSFLTIFLTMIVLSISLLTTSADETTEIFMNTDSDKNQPIEQLHILPGETLNLKSSHIAIRAFDLKKSLQPGMDVQFELVFGDSTTRAYAHVH